MSTQKMDAKKIQTYLKNKTHMEDQISTLLKATGAIITGSALLEAINGGSDDVKSMDIIVSLDKAQKLYVGLLNLKGAKVTHLETVFPSSQVDVYDTRHNILITQVLLVNDYSLHIIVSNTDDVTEIPKDCDMTFCQTWYDGAELWSMHPQDVLTKKGNIITPEVKEHVYSYINRGYKLENLEDVAVSEISSDVNPKIWTINFFVEYMITINMKYVPENTEINFSPGILIFDRIKEHTTDNGRDFYDFQNFIDTMTDFYSERITDTQHEHYDWDIDTLMYVAICAHSLVQLPTGILKVVGICGNSDESNILQEITGIKLYGPNPHGFPLSGTNSAPYFPMCTGTIPPFSAGHNGIDSDATRLDLLHIINEGQKLLRYNNMELNKLFQKYYARLALPMVLRQQQEGRARALARAQEQEDAEPAKSEEEPATGPFTIPNGMTLPGRCHNTDSTSDEDINTSSWYPTSKNIIFLMDFRDDQARIVNAELDDKLSSLVCTSVDYLMSQIGNENIVMYKCTSNIKFKTINEGDPLIERENFNVGDLVIVDDDDIREGIDRINLAAPYGQPRAQDFAEVLSRADMEVPYIPFTYGWEGGLPVTGYLPYKDIRKIIQKANASEHAIVFTIEYDEIIPYTVSKINTIHRISERGNEVSNNHCQYGSNIQVFKVKEFIGDEAPPPPPTKKPRRVIHESPPHDSGDGLDFDSGVIEDIVYESPDAVGTRLFSPGEPESIEEVIAPTTPVTPQQVDATVRRLF